MVRNMLPAEGFRQSIFDIRKPGDEGAVLGPYYPAPAYRTKQQFESAGCG